MISNPCRSQNSRGVQLPCFFIVICSLSYSPYPRLLHCGAVFYFWHCNVQGVRQDAKVSLPGENDFFLAFDAASNAAAEVGRVTLQELNAGEPRVFSVRRGDANRANPNNAVAQFLPAYSQEMIQPTPFCLAGL